MPSSDPLQILMAHGRWATRNILNACTPLTAEQFNQRFEMGPGSLHDTLTHMLSATRRWTDLLASREEGAKLDGTPRTPAELLTLLDEIEDDFDAAANAHPVQELVSREREGKTYTFTRGAVLTHVTTHTMHHRAQCLNMLRHLGIAPLPRSSVLEWMVAGELK